MVTLLTREFTFYGYIDTKRGNYIGYIDTKGVNLLCFVEHCIITFSPRDAVIN